MTDIVITEFRTIPSEPNYECNRLGEVRKKGSSRIKKLTAQSSGYTVTRLDGHLVYVHRIVAETFIPNPNNYQEIDHINNIRADNNYQNLRWVNKSMNNYNRALPNDVETIPENATKITDLRGSTFDNLYYFDRCFYCQHDYKKRRYDGYPVGNYKFWVLYDNQNNRVKFSKKQFLDQYPNFRSDFYPTE